jgi:glutamate/tyrosine decarboxylase-like PLP-dependent enzyme
VSDLQSLLERVLALVAEQRARYDTGTVAADANLGELRDAFRAPLPEHGTAAETVIDELAATAAPGLIASPSARYFGFVIGGSLPPALAADWLVSGWDNNSGLYACAPSPTVIEEAAGRWLVELFGFPEGTGVGFTTGTQMASFSGLAAGRHRVLANAGWHVERDGLQGAPKVRVIAGAERHVTIDVALRYLGLGAGTVEEVPTDDQGRMRADAFADVLAGGEGPTLVCAQAGNVNTGAFDPLEAICDAAASRGAWVHVDGAFGLWAAVVDELRPLAAGLDRADSWTTDAHKWLNVPYDCGVVMCRDPEAQRAAHGVQASYLVQGGAGAPYDPLDWVPEFSRRARGVPVYAAIRSLGRTGIAEIVARGCACARRFGEQLRAVSGVTVLNDVVLNQVLVRFGDSDAVTNAVIDAVQADGTCWVAGTVWHGVVAMRISVTNWQTTFDDVDASVDAMARCYAKVQT